MMLQGRRKASLFLENNLWISITMQYNYTILILEEFI